MNIHIIKTLKTGCFLLLFLGACTPDQEPEVLEVDTQTVVFDHIAGTQTFRITSNGPWTIQSSSADFRTDVVSGSGSREVVVSASAYNGADPRVALLTVCGVRGAVQRIEIVQGQTEGEVLRTIGTKNRFSTGEVIEIDLDAVANVQSIRKLSVASPDPQTIGDELFFVFDFKYRPQSFSYVLSVPNPQLRTLAAYGKGAWEALPKAYNEQGYAKARLTVVLNQTKAEEVLLRTALLDTTRFYSFRRWAKEPQGNNPLAGELHTNPASGVQSVELCVVGQNDNDINVSFEPKAQMVVPVLGLYKGDNVFYTTYVRSDQLRYRVAQPVYCAVPYMNNVVVDTRFESGFCNDPTQIYVTFGQPANMEGGSGWAPSDPHDGRLMVGYDQWGKLRMVFGFEDRDLPCPLRYNGKMVFARIVRSDETQIEVVDYVGNVLDTIVATKRIHHDIVQLDPNTWVALWADDPRGRDECGWVEYNTQTRQWGSWIDLRNVVSSTRRVTSDDLPDDPIHINSVVYDPTSDCFVASCRHQGIVKVKRTTGELQWIITPHVNLTPPHSDIDLREKVLTPTNFENIPENWNIGQHNATILADGSILCFDNHNTPIEGAVAADRYSRLVAFQVDQSKMTVRKMWTYATPDRKFSWYMGGAAMLANGNVLGTWPVQQYAAEVTYGTNRVVWEAMFRPRNTFGDIYRTGKISLYE